MTMTTVRENRARPAGRLGMASATSLRLEWVCTWWFWEQAIWVRPAELTGNWEREEGRRQNLSRPVKWSEGKVGKWESGRDATLLIMAYTHDTDVTRIRRRNETTPATPPLPPPTPTPSLLLSEISSFFSDTVRTTRIAVWTLQGFRQWNAGDQFLIITSPALDAPCASTPKHLARARIIMATELDSRVHFRIPWLDHLALLTLNFSARTPKHTSIRSTSWTFLLQKEARSFLLSRRSRTLFLLWVRCSLVFEERYAERGGLGTLRCYTLDM